MNTVNIMHMGPELTSYLIMPHSKYFLNIVFLHFHFMFVP